MELLERIRQLGNFHGIDFIGVAAIGKFKNELESMGGSGSILRNLSNALSIGIVFPKSIINLLKNRNIYENVFQYKHANQVIYGRLDSFASIVSTIIQNNGYRVMSIRKIYFQPMEFISISKYNKNMKIDNSIRIIGNIRAEANDFLIEEMRKVGIENVVPSHGGILMALFKNGELTMTEISTLVSKERSTVTTLVNKLIKQELVKQRKNPKDNRSNIVYLTQKGIDLKASFFKISEQLFEIEYRGLDEEEIRVFNDLLNRVHRNFLERKK